MFRPFLRIAPIYAVLVLTGVCSGQDAIPLIPAAAADGHFDPPEVVTPKGGVAIYVPPATVKSVKYVALDSEEAFDPSGIGGNPNAFLLFTRGLPEGAKYRFVGVASDEKGVQTLKRFDVVMPGAPKPGPVIPPTPVPPPSPPTPPPPSFPASMREKIQAAYDQDVGTTDEKNDLRRQLKVLYEQAVKVDVCHDRTIKTTTQLIEKMRESASKMTNEQLAGVRITIGEEYVSPLLLPDGPLTAEKRDAAHLLFRQLAAALDW